MEKEKREIPALMERPLSFFDRYGIRLNIILFIITLFSTFFFGLIHSLSFIHTDLLNKDPEEVLNITMFLDPQVISMSIVYVAVSNLQIL